jgi:hypothetical protein
MTLGARCRIEIAESKRLLDKVGAAARKALTLQGIDIRRTAKRSMKTVKDGRPSAPGSPPHRVTGLLADFLLWRYDGTAMSIVVGPVLLSGSKNTSPTIPEILETGGTEVALVRRGKEWKRRPVVIAPRPYMAPALKRSQEKLSTFWANSLTT